MNLEADIIAHHARLMGLAAMVVDGAVHVRSSPGQSDAGVTVLPLQEVLRRSVPSKTLPCAGERQRYHAVDGGGTAWGVLAGFHDSVSFDAPDFKPVVTDAEGRVVWAWQQHEAGGVLLIGTDLAADLTLLRQGNPAAAARRPTEAQWGIAGERPTYLFEAQLEADKPQERMADWWMWCLRDALVRHGHVAAEDILPFGAKGMVIVTGDDDQAYLEDYKLQAEKLAGLPFTYFLHPLTRHTTQTLAEHGQGRHVEWEIHPDALDAPHEYAELFAAQAAWFEGLTGRKPRLLRNHGFLNDGYWGHASAWLEHGVEASSNLPGVDGRVVNGSLLPARLALEGQLTGHWSLLTAFGDGVFFVYEWTAEQAVSAVCEAAKRVIDSNVPGIMVFNLHPANHEKAAGMNEAVKRLVSEWGFAAATLGDAVAWFKARDAGAVPVETPGMLAPYGLPTHDEPVLAPHSAPSVSTVQGVTLWQTLRRVGASARHKLNIRRSNNG